MNYELIIIGGGPAGCSAGVYAARKQLKTLLVTSEFGGQSIVSEDIQNWIGTPHISGADLAKSLKAHVEAYKGSYLEIKEGVYVQAVSKKDGYFEVSLSSGETFSAKSVLVTAGSSRRKLEAIGADRLEHKGLTYCASCDGPLFSDMDVVVIGGGNAAFETVAQLSAYCKTVTLIHRNETFKADEITVEKIKQDPKVRIITNAETLEVLGENFVSGIRIKHKDTGEEETLNISGVFVEIGQISNGGFMKDLVEVDSTGKIVIDPWTQKTSVEGIWAAGDITNIRYHQNNIASGDAVKAIEDAYLWIKHRK
ncbi:MAG TPA: FAD-dependent oxidoreductase [Candidatus Paceibacterota bacterium]|nr:FAD-dependent oxidoreductase [Candidatus Paceibacterota bacterium]